MARPNWLVLRRGRFLSKQSKATRHVSVVDKENQRGFYRLSSGRPGYLRPVGELRHSEGGLGVGGRIDSCPQ